MSEYIADRDSPIAVATTSSTEQICDPSVRREHYRQLLSETCEQFGETHVPDIVLWLQDSWSEIRKDCARWIRQNLPKITSDAGKLLFNNLIYCIRCGTFSWQALHGSLLGITELITENSENVSDIVRTLCLNLVGSSLAPVREAATACIAKLVISKQISTAVLISTILSSITNLNGKYTMHMPISYNLLSPLLLS